MCDPRLLDPNFKIDIVGHKPFGYKFTDDDPEGNYIVGASGCGIYYHRNPKNPIPSNYVEPQEHEEE